MIKRKDKDRHALTIDYARLGTISLENLKQAIWEDIQALVDMYNVKFVTGVKFVVPATDEYGAPVFVRHPAGHIVHKVDTQHYRPACLDYRL